MASDIPNVCVPYSGVIPWFKDSFDSATGTEFFKNRDHKYCLNLCSQIENDVKKLNDLKTTIDNYFYRPRSSDARSPRETVPVPYRASLPALEEPSPVELHLHKDKAQEFATVFNEFTTLLRKVVTNSTNLTKYLDDNHNTSTDLWNRASPLPHYIAELIIFQNEKRAFCPKINYIPPGKNIRRALNIGVHGFYSNVIQTPSQDFFNYLSLKTGTKVGAVAVLAFGTYGAYLSYNFVSSDYLNIAYTVVCVSAGSYALYNIRKLFKQNTQENVPEITLKITALANDGSFVKLG